MSHTTGTAVKAGRGRRTAFSMIELVIVVVIIGIIAAIALPRMSRGAAAAHDAALAQNLAILRNGLDLYATEHGGSFPTVANVADALTKYTKSDGTIGTASKDEVNGFIYGPYLRVIPPMSVGDRKGQTGISNADGATIGWLYDPTGGTVQANAVGVTADAAKKNYSSY